MIFETPRTLVRKFVAEDFGDLLELYSDEEVLRYEIDGPTEYADVEFQLAQTIEDYNTVNMSAFSYGIELKSTSKIIGLITYHYKDPEQLVCEIGGWLNSKNFQNGLGMEVGSELLKHIFSSQAIRIYCATAHKNIAALKLIDKLGFVKEGHIRMGVWKENEFLDEICFGLMKDEYESRGN